MVIVFNKLEVDIVWFVRLNGKNLTKNTQKQEMEKVFFGKKILIYIKCNAVKSELFLFVLGLLMHHQRRAIFTKTCVATLDETLIYFQSLLWYRLLVLCLNKFLNLLLHITILTIAH